MTSRILDGREVYIRPALAVDPDLALRIGAEMLAALIDAEAILFDYAQQSEYPSALLPTVYKVRNAIRAAEDPDRKVSVRT